MKPAQLSDCLLYLVRLADRCGLDLAAASLDKMAKNRRKYPADRAFGRSDKYTAYEEGQQPAAAAAAAAAAITPVKQQPAASPRQHGSPTDPTARLGAPVPYAGGAAAPEIHFGRAALLAAALLAAAFAAGSALGARRR